VASPLSVETKDADVAFSDLMGEERTVFFEGVVDDAIALGHREEVRDKPEESARRNDVIEPGVGAIVVHIDELASAIAENGHDIADEFVRDIDLEILVRLALDAIDLFDDDLRLGDFHFEAFAAHRLNQNAKVQLAPSGNNPGFGVRNAVEFERNIALSLFEKTLFDDPGGDFLAILSPQRRGVGAEFHLQGGFIDTEGGKGSSFFGSQTVSETPMSVRPAMPQMSPAST
jgi:hypothetical protein